MKKRYMHVEHEEGAVLRHFAFFNSIPEHHRPPVIRREEGERYSYDYVEGHQPSNQYEVDAVYDVCLAQLWSPCGRPLEADVLSYVSYVRGVADRLIPVYGVDVATIASDAASLILGQAHNLNESGKPIHGDLTMENVLINLHGEVVFIDPGHNRGLNVIELDQAKILQSTYLKWDLMNQSSGFYMVRPPFTPRSVHFAFLATHVIRLLAHHERHSVKVRECAFHALRHLSFDHFRGVAP